MNKRNPFYIALIVAVLGVVLFSAKAVLVKLAYQYDVEAIPLLLFRMAFSLPVYAVVALISRPKKPQAIRLKDYFWIFIFGFIGYYLASLFDFIGLQYIKASLERIILFAYPTLVVFISWLFLKERPAKVQLVAIVISYVGILITFYDELDVQGQGSGVIFGGIMVLLSAITYASYLVGSGWLIPKFGATTFTSYAMIISCLCVMVHYGLFIRSDLFHYPKEVYWLGFAMAMLSTVIPSYMVSFAIKHMGAASFSIVGSLGPFSTIVLANIFLEEQMTILQLAGAVVVIVGVMIVSKAKK
ncbi:DMT family transporter [Fulvivirga sp. M361]|uniref:DMT family transporter n=1 Tax=Fulvivirga sp. M361 TaxID=2594266 RepID=UPI00117A4F8B|nr:DMT family transporter [Fulvivirga sp. M361]TRX62106.1 DMT family transporter [Fulvivirga sp. M361]